MFIHRKRDARGEHAPLHRQQLRPRTTEHNDVARRRFLVEKLAQFHHQRIERRWCIAALGHHDQLRILLGISGNDALGDPPLSGRDRTLGGLGQRGAEAKRSRKCEGEMVVGGDALGEFTANERAARPAPLVNSLVVIANNRHTRARSSEKFEQTELRVIDILKLIEHEMLESVGKSVTAVTFGKCGHRIGDEIVKGAKSLRFPSFFKAPIHRRQKLIRCMPRAFRRNQHGLPLTDRLEATLGVASIFLVGMLVALGEFLADAVAHDAQDLAAISDERHARHRANRLKMAHDAESERVPSLHTQLADIDSSGGQP